MYSFRFLSVNELKDRIAEILREMPEPERGKQTRLAEIADCSKGLINQLLKNPAQTLGYEYAKNIERRLGYRVDWILDGQLPKKLGQSKDGVAASSQPALDGEELLELMLLYKQATGPSRLRILRYARTAEKSPGELRAVLPVDNP
jgi:hypothetical protein